MQPNLILNFLCLIVNLHKNITIIVYQGYMRQDRIWELNYKLISFLLTRGPFLESPENFSGPKSKLSNCNPLV